jgi:putative ABC transport system permease protein
MNILKQNLKYHWRVNLAAGLASAICIAIITGALVIGSTVKHSLTQQARQRLGFVQAVVNSPTGSFNAATAVAIQKSLIQNNSPASDLKIAVVNARPATAINPADMRQVGNIQMLGIDDSLAAATGNAALAGLGMNQAVVNSELARRLDLKVGDDIILQFSGDNMVAELALYAGDDYRKSWRVTVAAIIAADEFGAFSLHPRQQAICNVFVPADQLQNRINPQSSSGGNQILMSRPANIEPASFDQAVSKAFSLAELGIKLNSEPGYSNIKTAGIFFDLKTATTLSEEFALGQFTGYLINSAKNTTNGKANYYSFAGTGFADTLDENSVVINDWLAQTISAGVGNKLELAYYLPADNGQLIEQSVSLTVSQIVPIAELRYMAGLMPDIPGMTDSADCSNWDAGVPVDMAKITDEDEEYWDEYKTTPKLVISYKLAEKLFAGRYGLATALYQSGEFTATQQAQLEKRIKELLPLPISHVDLEAKHSVDNSLDFGGLFLALSMFLVASALLLPAMLLGLNIQNRSKEIATLKALGWPAGKIKWLILTEISIVSKLGIIPGVLLGLLYAGLLNSGLSGAFAGATGGLKMQVHADAKTIIIGVLVSVTLVILTAWLKCRAILKQTVKSAFTSINTSSGHRPARRPILLALAILALAGAIALPLATGGSIMGYFSGGSCLLIGLLALSAIMLRSYSQPGMKFSGRQMLWNNLARGSSSTMSVIISLSCGMFMVIAVGLNHHNPLTDSDKASGPTGGFDYVAQCSIALTGEIESQGDFLAFRMRAGDDASCLNLNRPGEPTIIAVDEEKMRQYSPFSFAATAKGQPQDWSMLNDDNPDDNIIPAVTDNNTILWALHKSLGDLLTIKDAAGREYQLRLCGGLQSSILQGKMIISEDAFKRIFPSENGYRLILFDEDEQISGLLAEHGPEIRRATDILSELYGVENTYMSLFALLGGLGMIMGNFVLALTVLRDSQSRRREYAIMSALGFSKGQLLSQIVQSYSLAACAGLLTGSISAIFAVWPKIMSNYANLPLTMITSLTAAIVILALVCIIVAGYLAASSKLAEKRL